MCNDIPKCQVEKRSTTVQESEITLLHRSTWRPGTLLHMTRPSSMLVLQTMGCESLGMTCLKLIPSCYLFRWSLANTMARWMQAVVWSEREQAAHTLALTCFRSIITGWHKPGFTHYHMSLTFHFLLCSFVSHTFGPLLNPISHSPLSPHPTNKMFCTLHCVHRVYGVMTVHAKLDIEQALFFIVHTCIPAPHHTHTHTHINSLSTPLHST